MRKLFPGYYRPSDAEFRRLWEKCLFVLDANVLLNLYRYSSDTRNTLLDILTKVETRLWVPHQAAWEYQRNRLEVITAQREAYDKIEQLLETTKVKLESDLKVYTRHPLIDPAALLKPIADALDAQAKQLENFREKHPDFLDTDEVRDALTKLLEGSVGQPYDESRVAQIRKEGEERYSKGIPPGFRDAKGKTGDAQYGDLVLWYQVIDKAIQKKVPIVIVTDDVKEDWWWRHGGKIVGPRPELIEEINKKAGVEFYMYRSDQFMEQARQYLKHKVDQESIEEIREVRKQDEQRRREFEHLLSEREARIAAAVDEYAAIEERSNKIRSEIQSLQTELDELESLPAQASNSELLSSRRTALRQMLATLNGHATALDAHRHAIRDSIERSGGHEYGRVPLSNRSALYSLSLREQAVAELVAKGASNQEIGKKLGISEHTIKNYLFRIFNKFGISTRVELVLLLGGTLPPDR